MILSLVLAALLVLPGCFADFMEIIPIVQSSGHLPQGYRIRFMFAPLPAPNAATIPQFVNLDFLGLTNANTGVAVDWGWVPFIKNINAGAAVAPTFTGWVFPATAFLPVLAAYSWSASAPPQTPLSIPNIGTSNTGRRLFWTFAPAPAATMLNAVWEWAIPLQYLASNPPYVEVHIGFSFAWSNLNGGGLLSQTTPVDVPWKTASTQLITSSLHLERVDPSSTIQAAQLTSLNVIFTPGKQLVGGAWLALVIVANSVATTGAVPTVTYVGLFNAAPAAPAGQTLPTIAVGVGGCQSTPSDIYCCSQSVATQSGGAQDRTRLRIQLLPLGCVLPAGKQASFVVPQNFLGTNPTIPAAIAAPAGPAGAQSPIRLVVNAWLESSSDPQSHHEARLGQTWTGFNGGVINAPPTLDQDATSIQFGNYFGSWIIGINVVTNFQAIPSTLTSQVVPQSLVLRWTLVTAIPDSTVVAAQVVAVAARFVITANAGVFRPNVGAWNNQVFFPPTTGACTQASYYTNEFGTLFITPNPLPVVAGCYTGGLTAGTVLTYTIPTSVLMPNPTPQTVLFDISGIPDQLTAPVIGAAGATNYYALGIDSATLKSAVGYTTTANCNTDAVPNFLFTSPNDIASLQIADRNRLVAAISAMSTGPAAIRQCLSGAVGGTVSWVKYPEAAWTQSAWPLTNVAANGNWAQQVGVNPPIFIQNWGQMVSYPMYAIVVTYPPQAASLSSLGIVDSVPAAWRLAFIVRIDRLTLSGAVASLANPWQFYVTIATPVLAVRHIGTGNVVRAVASVSPVENLVLGQWAQTSNGQLLVVVPQSGVVFGYTGVFPSPVPDNGSDDALFGLLALIAVPVLLCCCLLALLWFLRPKAEACPCVPEYPVQEMYWVNAQPCAPTFSVAQCGPATTPVYLVQ